MRVPFDFVPFIKLKSKKEKELCDVKGYITKISDARQSNSKNGIVTKRSLEIVDESKIMSRVVLWNDVANEFKASKYDLICIKNGKVGTFTSKQISINEGTLFMLNPKDLVIASKSEIKKWIKIADGKFVI